jgi:hypothetical protein
VLFHEPETGLNDIFPGDAGSCFHHDLRRLRIRQPV